MTEANNIATIKLPFINVSITSSSSSSSSTKSPRSPRIWRFPSNSSCEKTERFRPLSLIIPTSSSSSSSKSIMGDNNNYHGNRHSASSCIDNESTTSNKRRSWIFSFPSSSNTSNIDDQQSASTTSKSISPEEAPPPSKASSPIIEGEAKPFLGHENKEEKEAEKNEILPQWPNKKSQPPKKERSNPSTAELDSSSPVSTSPSSNIYIVSMLKPIILSSNDGRKFTLPISAILDSKEIKALYFKENWYNDIGIVKELNGFVLGMIVEYLLHHATFEKVLEDDWDWDWAKNRTDDELKILVDGFKCIGNISGQTLLQKEILKRAAMKPVNLPRGVNEWKKTWNMLEQQQAEEESSNIEQ